MNTFFSLEVFYALTVVYRIEERNKLDSYHVHFLTLFYYFFLLFLPIIVPYTG